MRNKRKKVSISTGAEQLSSAQYWSSFNPLPPPSADLVELYRVKCDTPKFNGVFFNNLFWGRGQSSYVWSMVYTSHVAME